ncbi:MAG: N-acetylmuramoyl-L-alanine amidase [Terriglobales bacterium]
MQTQASTTLTRGSRAFRLGAALLIVLMPAVAASARVHHNDAWARQEFAKADRMREALNGRPLGERTRREYQRVIDAYRRVYFGSPASSKADPSVVATAELMVEMGRRFDDDKILRGAIEQYRFLRKEYPGSKYRFGALFTIAEIYKDDLDDSREARATFEEFLHRYPRNHLAEDARAAVKEIDAEVEEAQNPAQTGRKQRTANVSASAEASVNGVGSDEAASDTRRNGLPRVTGVRHWSTPDYTRVAIDVEREVKYTSQRISHPDRIFFDLRDTKLASTLVGKTFDVDDGFLKKIRVAEFQPGRTRVVLEVDDLASYDAFLLPDPYRLIIDIHGKQKHGTAFARAEAAKAEAAGGVVDADVPPAASTESDDNGGGTASSTGDTERADSKIVERRAKSASEKRDLGVEESGKDAVHFAKSAPVESDIAPEGMNPDAEPAASGKRNNIGVVKTTVAVKGSKRRIPKTIVEADDSAPSMVAKLDNEKIRPEAVDKDAGASGTDEDDSDTASSTASSLASSSSLASPSGSPNSLHRKKSRSGPTARDTADLPLETREARPTADGDRSLTRVLGLKIGKIVIDAGHGGHDTGTIGPDGLLEKDVVLDVAKRLGRLLETRLGAEVVYTRRDDTFVPLETRTAIANRERADLFISIHANSSRDPDARGVETYYLNFTSSPDALEVAARENAVSEQSIYQLQDLVKKIALKEKIEESREFAGDVQESLYTGLALNSAGIRDRGVKKAPFIVLIGANMPSILAEISFLSNPTDDRKLESSQHRQRIAESLYRGVARYANGLSGVKVASKIDKGEGQ